MKIIKSKSLIFLLVFLVIPITLYATTKTKDKVISEKKVEKTKKNSTTKKSKISAILEFVPQATVPVGYLAKVYKGGGGFRFGTQFKLPLKKESSIIKLYMGPQWGLNFIPSYRGLVFVSPIYAELMLLFPLGVASPYLRFGGGIMVSTYFPSQQIKDEFSESNLKRVSADGMVSFTFGSYFNPPKVKAISILLETQFIAAIEQNSGFFFNIGFGIAYHFNGGSN